METMSNADTLIWVAVVCTGALGLYVVGLEPRCLARWSFAIGTLIFAMESAFFGLTVTAVTAERMVYWQNWALLAKAFLPGIWLLFSLTYARGNGREFLASSRYWLMAAFVIPVGLALWFFGRLIVSVGQAKPQGEWGFGLGVPGLVVNLVFLLGAVLVLMNLESTYRASVGTMRWRVKFMILGLGLIFAVRAYTSSQVLLFRAIYLPIEVVGAMALLFGGALILRGLLRPGHFAADIYPSRVVPYNSASVLIAGIYLFIVGVFAKAVALLGGDATFTLKAFVLLVAVVLGAILLLSDRARLVARRFASRHFQRPLYDYRSLWRKFTEATGSCVRQTDLCVAATKLASDVFQALSASIWLMDDRRENLALAASTLLTDIKAEELKPTEAETQAVIRALEGHPDPIDLDASEDAWAESLRRCHPNEFQKGGHRVCVPLIGGGELLGLIIVGDRVSGAPFSWQDFDLLKCVADSVAASLLNLQLSQKLLQARELEAFQTMSAFFVHDLKNTASTLNLMLKNLPVHFDDPAFREDALRGISKTVTHINRLIHRLSQLRHELQIKPVESDLNVVVAKALDGWENADGVNLIKDLHPIPKILLDQEQMLKVVTNLALNAREAVSSTGQVRIETAQNNGWVTLTVSDNGNGMDPEFLNRSLFRPFQTTKKNGLGIGLFQCKMIVEAHNGKIQVESQPGKGTTFRVILPLPKPN
jgi:putative PEP-CTERM system histidine kinase